MAEDGAHFYKCDDIQFDDDLWAVKKKYTLTIYSPLLHHGTADSQKHFCRRVKRLAILLNGCCINFTALMEECQSQKLHYR